MKAFTSIFRRNHRPRTAPESPRKRKRPARSFDATCATLEGRALLTVLSASASIPTVVSLPAQATYLNPPPPPSHDHNAFSDTGEGSHGQGGAGYADPADSMKGHVALDVEPDGQSGPEFAIADATENKVIVKIGMNGAVVTLGTAQGIDGPQSVTLADLNDDGILDLIVANTGADNVLVFPGLPDGQFGPAIGGAGGYAVGSEPVSVTVDYVEDNPEKADLIVANKASHSVTILDGQYNGGAWSATQGGSIETPNQPVKTLLYDDNADGMPDLLVCNSGSDDVTMYQGLAGGSFDDTATATFLVGSNPQAMIIGAFGRRSDSDPDLITINAGSNNLTDIGGLFSSHPTTQTISSGGTTPDAAFAFDPNRSGVLDLVVANGGDGNVAVFKGGSEGLQLAGVINQSNVPTPTAVAPSASSDGKGIDFFAASAGDDAALLLHFDLGIASTYLPGNSDASAAIAPSDGELFAQLMPLDDSSMELIAVFSAGSPDSDAIAGASNLREPTTITALYSPTEGQGAADSGKLPEGSSGPSATIVNPVDPSTIDSVLVDRFVSGVLENLALPYGYIEAVASRDLPEVGDDRPIEGLASLAFGRPPGDRPFDTSSDVEAGSGLVEEALRLFWSGGTPGEGRASTASPSKPDPAPELDGVDAPPLEIRLETIPLVSATVAASARLILKTSPPRPSTFTRKPGPRPIVSLKHDPKPGPRSGPV